MADLSIILIFLFTLFPAWSVPQSDSKKHKNLLSPVCKQRCLHQHAHKSNAMTGQAAACKYVCIDKLWKGLSAEWEEYLANLPKNTRFVSCTPHSGEEFQQKEIETDNKTSKTQLSNCFEQYIQKMVSLWEYNLSIQDDKKLNEIKTSLKPACEKKCKDRLGYMKPKHEILDCEYLCIHTAFNKWKQDVKFKIQKHRMKVLPLCKKQSQKAAGQKTLTAVLETQHMATCMNRRTQEIINQTFSAFQKQLQ